MKRTSVFRNNRSQAVRLPKELAFPDDVRQVEVTRVGAALLLTPVGQRWDDFFSDVPLVSTDYMSERHQPDAERREEL